MAVALLTCHADQAEGGINLYLGTISLLEEVTTESQKALQASLWKPLLTSAFADQSNSVSQVTESHAQRTVDMDKYLH